MQFKEFLPYISGEDEFGDPKCHINAVFGADGTSPLIYEIGKCFYNGFRNGDYYILNLDFRNDSDTLSRFLSSLREFEDRVITNGGEIRKEDMLFFMFSSSDYPEYGYIGTIRPAFWALTSDKAGKTSTMVKMSFLLKDISYFGMLDEAGNHDMSSIDTNEINDILVLKKNERNEADDGWLSE